MSKKYTTDDAIQKMKNKHGDRYDYNLVIYAGKAEKVTVVCNSHSKPFSWDVKAENHWNGSGCPKCGRTARAQCRPKTTSKFIEEANKIHDSLYTYENSIYVGKDVKLLVTCSLHGDWLVSPNLHLSHATGCPTCSRGWNRKRYENISATLYYVKINHLYKVGLTTKKLKYRFADEIRKGYRIEILKTTFFEDGIHAFEEEQKILKKYKSSKYLGKDILRGGNSELFIENVLNISSTFDYL